MKRPDDIQPTLLWYTRELEPAEVRQGNLIFRTTGGWHGYSVVNPDAHTDPCRVYWGSHGCSRPKGHDGDHWCDCCKCEDHPDRNSGCVAGPPYYGADTHFYGEDDAAVPLSDRHSGRFPS